jgi:hypothetical protein
MTKPLTRAITALLFTGGLLLVLSARAELIAVEKNAEADHVRILFTNGLEEGMAQVSGCQECPFNLNINGQTRFFQDGKEIERRKVVSFSGKSATVIYSMDGKQALRIRW